MHVVVVGTGIAGLLTAILASERHEVTLVTKGSLTDSNTSLAQGGIAAAITPPDTPQKHATDTLAAGAGLCDDEAVRQLCAEAPDAIEVLASLGIQFDRLDGPDSPLAVGREAAHSEPRIVHAGGDQTGAAIIEGLIRALPGRRIALAENCSLAEIITDNDAPGERQSVIGVDLLTSKGYLLRVPAVAAVLATGGAGQLFRHTTNPEVATGDGVACALRAGAAAADLEMYQFHPTALAVPGTPLISEAVRGEGAVLVDEAGRRFLFDVHPAGELAPRDVVARGIWEAMERQGGRPVMLDATGIGADRLDERFPTFRERLAGYGLDPAVDLLPITPAAHYWMGGIATGADGRTSLRGLWAVGEAACTGAHGANRLASNSLAESAVFALNVALSLDEVDDAWLNSLDELWPFMEDARELPGPGADVTHAVPAPAPSGDLHSVEFSRERLQELMWSCVGLIRDAAGLAEAARAIDGWMTQAAETTAGAAAEAFAAVTTPGAEGGEGTEGTAAAFLAASEDENLLLIARAIIAAALARTESRGAHARSDFPTTDPDQADSILWTLPDSSPQPEPLEVPAAPSGRALPGYPNPAPETMGQR